MHVHYFLMGTTFWALYYLWGLSSNYFQAWSFIDQLLWVVMLPTLVLGVAGWRRTSRLGRREAWRLASVMAFHFTFPLFAYDVRVLADHQGLGMSFVISHWYLSVFYLIPWVLLPLIVVAQPRSRE